MYVCVYSKWKSKALEESRGILAFVTFLSGASNAIAKYRWKLRFLAKLRREIEN